MHPTLCEIADAEASGLPERDGVSLVSLLQKPELTLDRPLFWHYPHYSNQGGFPGGAVRQGPWKLIERYEDGDCHLFNLEDDPGEKTDLASRFPGRVDQLKQLLHAWYVDVDARFLEKREAEQTPWRP